MKLVLIITACIFIAFVLYTFISHKSLNNRYNDINIGDTDSIVLRTVGKPKQVEQNPQNRSYENWNYYIWPLPRVYTVVIGNNVVVAKYDSISP